MGVLGKLVGLRGEKLERRAAKEEQRRLEDDRDRAGWMVDKMDWKPELASDHVPTYQRSQSPEADAFLSTLLSGENPAAISPTQAGGQAQKAVAQKRFDRATGGWDALRQKQAALNQSTPWELKPFTREIDKPDVTKEAYVSEQSGGALSLDEVKALEAGGFKFDHGDVRTKKSGRDAVRLLQDLGIDSQTEQGQQALRGIAREIQGGRRVQDIWGDYKNTKYLGGDDVPGLRGAAAKANVDPRQAFLEKLIEEGR